MVVSAPNSRLWRVRDWRAARDAIRGFYADRLFTPLWVDAEVHEEALHRLGAVLPEAHVELLLA